MISLRKIVGSLLAVPVLTLVGQVVNVSAVDYPMPVGFEDQTFYDCIVKEFMQENPFEEVPEDGLRPEQLATIHFLDCNWLGEGEKITKTTGIEQLIGLKDLSLNDNQIEDIDLRNILSLETLFAIGNRLTNLDLTQNPNLRNVHLTGNELPSIDVSQNPLLDTLNLSFNKLTEIDVSLNPLLKYLSLVENQISVVDVSHNPLLEYLDVDDGVTVIWPETEEEEEAEGEIIAVPNTGAASGIGDSVMTVMSLIGVAGAVVIGLSVSRYVYERRRRRVDF